MAKRKPFIPAPALCPDCGKTFIPARWTQKYCDDCRRHRKQRPGHAPENAKRIEQWQRRHNPTRTCRVCGKPVERMQTLCASCKSEALSAAYKRDKAQKPHTCRICGRAFTSVARNARVCASCKADANAMRLYRATLAAAAAERKLQRLLNAPSNKSREH